MIKNQNAFTLYHGKFVLRLLVLLVALAFYIASGNVFESKALTAIAWVFFAFEMVCKLFPLKYESMGSQKQFRKNFVACKEKVHVKIENQKRVLIVALLWIVLNGVIAHFHLKNVIDDGIMVLISLFYSVCDMICVLFFCPFQRIVGNKCCTTCRIHNWDYVMMFTPMLFVDGVFTKSLFYLGLIIFIRWEYNVFKHPERFCEKSNYSLSCAECKEIRCSRKGYKKFKN